MNIRNSLRITLLSGVCLLPLAAYAADADDSSGFDVTEGAAAQGASQPSAGNPGEQEIYDNSVDIGLREQSKASAAFGRYNGSYNGGVDAVGDFRFQKREDWKSGDTYYYDLKGRDLSFGARDNFDIAPNSSVDLRVGNQGIWGVTMGWSASTYTQSDNFHTLFDKNGHTVAGFAPAKYSMTSADAGLAYQVVDSVGTRRDKGTLGINYVFGDWTVTGGYSHEHKEGTIEQSLTNAGSNGGFAYFPMPINYDTDRFDIAAAFNTAKLQTKFTYTFSNFQDNNAGGFTYSPYLAATTGSVSGIYSQAPNSIAHTFGTQVGYNIDDVTRLNANLSYGLQLQNDTMDQPTLNVYDPTSSYILPKSLNGFVQNIFGNVAVISHPTHEFDYKVAYTLDQRQVNTGENSVWANSYADKYSTTITERLSFPESWTKQTAMVEAGYKILPSTKVTAGYTYTNFNRTEALVRDSKDNDLSLKIRTTFTPDVIGSVNYDHSVRSASAPNFNIWQFWNSSDCQSSTMYYSKCQAIPTYEEARTRDQVSGRLTWNVNHDVNVGLVSKYAADNYPYKVYGVGRDDKISAGPDLTYRVTDDADAHFFYTYQHIYRALVDAGTNTSTTDNNNSAYGNDTSTAGVSGSWKVSHSLKLKSEYVFSYGAESVNQSGIWAASSGLIGDNSLPQVTSMLNSFKLNGEYEYMPGVSIFLGYSFDRLIISDWQIFGATNESIPNDGNPSYNIHTVTGRVAFKW